MGYPWVILIIKDITVKLFTADDEFVGELPHITFEVVADVPLSVPNGAVQRLPINPIVKPSDGSVNTGIEGLNGVEKSAADVSDVAAIERKTVTLFVTVAVFKVEENGQFEQDARLVNDTFTEMCFDNGVGGSKSVGIMISPAKHTGGMSPVDVG